MQARFAQARCRETIRTALHRLGLSWKKARKLLGRANPGRRAAFIEQLGPLLDGAQRDRHHLVYLDEAHVHQDVDLGHGWGERGKRFHVASSSPGLSAKVSFYGLYLFNEGQVRIWPYPCANGEHTIDVLHRLRAEFPKGRLVVVWDGAPCSPLIKCRCLMSGTTCRATEELYGPTSGGAERGHRFYQRAAWHRAKAVWVVAASLGITLAPLPGYSPDLMPVEALWRWLREDVTYHHCHATADDLTRRVAAFEARINQNICTVADRLWVKEHLDPEEEKLRFSN